MPGICGDGSVGVRTTQWGIVGSAVRARNIVDSLLDLSGAELVSATVRPSIPRDKDGFGRLTFKPIEHADYRIWPARYAKGMCVVTCPSPDGYKTRAARLADAISHASYVGRSGGYHLTSKQAERFMALYEAGWDGTIFGELVEPKAT